MRTYKELLDLCLDYMGAETTPEGLRYARQAVQSAMIGVQNQRRWTYYYNQLRITTNAMQTTGTVAYDHTGGAYERMLTLTGGTWPTWATFGSVVIANVPYEVAEYQTTTIITLAELSNPGADIASGTAYTLYRDTYPLPADFVQLDTPHIADRVDCLEYMQPDEWLNVQSSRSQGTPSYYTLRGDPNYMGALAISFYPAPDTAYTIDSVYTRKPKPLLVDEYNTGSVTTNSATVTGSGTSWDSTMVGTVIRFSSGSQKVPTGLAGSDPYYVERTVMSVTSSTQLEMDAASGFTLTGVKYSISDPVDIEESMFDLLRLECYKQLRTSRRVKPASPEEIAEYERTRIRAHEADARSMAPRAEGRSYYRVPWLWAARTSNAQV